MPSYARSNKVKESERRFQKLKNSPTKRVKKAAVHNKNCAIAGPIWMNPVKFSEEAGLESTIFITEGDSASGLLPKPET